MSLLLTTLSSYSYIEGSLSVTLDGPLGCTTRLLTTPLEARSLLRFYEPSFPGFKACFYPDFLYLEPADRVFLFTGIPDWETYHHA